MLYGEYEKFDDAAPDVLVNACLNSSTQLWGLGVVQEIDAAAMSLWLSYRHIDADIDGIGCEALPLLTSVSTLAALPTASST